MRIVSMTATFGKLSRQTLTLNPEMNIIEAPNEWGKSTWCAFLVSMLYGIDTGSRTKTGFLADKEHYAPWSGEPMSGSMDIVWNGREITIQRQNKGRVPLGEVKAFETHTGVPVPELEVAAPGHVLLGVERSVFARAGFIRMSEMPVTEDESLRRRLNELVTTGEESGASDDLSRKLRDLKNKCRFNKKGLLPELEAKQADLEQKLQQMQGLASQIDAITRNQQLLEEEAGLLVNHQQALAYAEQLQYLQKLAAAQVNRDAQLQKLQQAQAQCAELPSQEEIGEKLAALQQLRDTRDELHTRAQLLPPLPQMPVAEEPFRGKSPESAVSDAKQDCKTLQQLSAAQKRPLLFYGVGGLCLLAGLTLPVFSELWVGGAMILLCGIALIFAGVGMQRKLKQQMATLQKRYGAITPDCWEIAAEQYANAQQTYTQSLQTRQQELEKLNRDLEENAQAVERLTQGQSFAQFEEACRQQQLSYDHLQEQERLCRQAEDVLQALSGTGKQAKMPEFADNLTLSAEDTAKRIGEVAVQRQLLHQKLGQCQGQMEALGQQEALLAQKQQVQIRIAALERVYRAACLGQEVLQQATQELQRRFAPRISQRAQALFARLTGGRYQRMHLGQDLSMEAGASDENTLRGTLWRSDGTVDQLYLALRLAVAEELTPTAPLVLDDALVRFDDTRLSAALEILREASAEKQVIVFTCQSREKVVSDRGDT